MNMCDDILQTISLEELVKVRDLYKNYSTRTLLIYNYLNTAIEWKIKFPEENYITVMVPHGKLEKGTFVAIGEYDWHEIVMFTLEDKPDILHQIIVETKKIDWQKGSVLYGIDSDQFSTVIKALKQVKFPLKNIHPCHSWSMQLSKANGLNLNCPEEVYLRELNKSHATTINKYWPYNHIGALNYTTFLIETCGGHGVFLKSTDDLIGWIIGYPVGMGMLHVLEEHTRKGYGALVTKSLAKCYARKGIDPLATVLTTNTISQCLFSKIDFEQGDIVYYLESCIPEKL